MHADQAKREPVVWPFARVWTSALLLILLFSSLNVGWVLDDAASSHRADLASDASRVAFSLRKSFLMSLDGTPAERDRPEFGQIHRQLTSVARIYSHWDGCYLLMRRPDGTVYFLDNIDLMNGRAIVQHGQPYLDCPPEVAAVFDTGRAAVAGPYRNAFGSWITAASPVLDPVSGQVLAVFGVDISRREMQRHLLRASLCSVSFTVAIAAVLVLWRWRSRARSRLGESLGCLDVAAILLVGMLVAVMLFLSYRKVEAARLKTEFELLASQKSRSVVNAIQTIRTKEMGALGLVVQTQEGFNPGAFGLLADQFLTTPAMTAWGWAPEVAESERAEFEVAASRFLGQPFALTESAGTLPAPEGAAGRLLHPILVMRPESGLRALGAREPGLDISGLIRFAGGLQPHFEAGRPTATPLLPAMADAGVGPHKLVFLKIPSATRPSGAKGVVVGIFEPQRLFDIALNATPDRNHLIRMHLFEISGTRGETTVLASHPAADVPAPEHSAILDRVARHRLDIVQPCAGFGSLYYVCIHPEPAFFAQYRSRGAWLVLGLGAAITLLAAALVHVLGRRHDAMLALVEERTDSLTKSVARYERMALNSRTISMTVTADGVVKEVSASIRDVLGFSPEAAEQMRFQALLPSEGEGIVVMDKVLPPMGVSWSKRHALVGKDGRTRWFASSFHFGRSAAGGEACWEVTSTDVTEAYEAERELVTRERKYRSLVEDLGDVVVELDAETLRFTYVSPAITRLGHGLAPADLVGRVLGETGVFQNPEAIVQGVRDAVAGTARLLDAVVAGNGSRDLDVEITLRHFHDRSSGRGMVGAILRDVSFKKKREKYQRLAMTAMQILAGPEDFNVLLGRLVDVVRRETGVDEAGIRMGDGRDFPFVASARRAADGAEPDPSAAHGVAEGWAANHPTCGCLCGFVIQTALPEGWRRTAYGTAWTNDLDADVASGRLNPVGFSCCNGRFASIVFAPIRASGETVGLLKLDSRLAGEFPEDIIPMVEAIAAQIGESFERRKIQNDYRALFHEMAEAVIVVETVPAESGRVGDLKIVAVNPSLGEIAGLEPASALNARIGDLFPGDAAFLFDAAAEAVAAGEGVRREFLSKDLGRHLVASVVPISEREVALIFADVSARVESERSLRESRRQYASLIANIPGMVYRYMLEGGWKLQFMSEGSVSLSGHAASEFMSGRVGYDAIVDPAYRKTLWDAWQRLVVSGGVVHIEYSIMCKDGSRRWVLDTSAAVQDEAGAFLAVEGFVFDITERKEAEEIRARFAMAMDQSRDAVLITDEVGVVQYANAASFALTGELPDEVVGTTMPLFALPPADEEAYHKMWRALLRGRVWEAQMQGARKDGTAFSEQVSVAPVRDASGKTISFLVIRRDVTRDQLDAKERDRLREQLAQVSKMESVGQLAGGVAHDFNNMLQAILGYSEMAMIQLGEGHPVHADILAVRNAARRAAELTQKLLVFARKSKFEIVPVNVPAALKNLTGLLKRIIGEDVAFELNLPESSFWIKADANQLDQAITNLCINARDAIGSRPGGSIILRSFLWVTEASLVTATGTLPRGRYAVIAVSDNGSGIPPAVLSRMFEPFFTTKPKGKGTGLGLSTVYGAMKACGGGVLVSSVEGVGTTFELYFPQIDPEEAKDALGDAAAIRPLRVAAGHGETVLLVDDEEAVMLATRRMLESIGYAVIATTSPLQAIEIVRERGGDIQLLVTDVIMPEMNGTELVRNIRTILPKLRCLYISGYTGNILADQGISEDGGDCIHKPFTRATLAQRIRDCLDASAKEPG